MADRLLGTYASPFSCIRPGRAAERDGISCQRLPLDDLVKILRSENDGTAEIAFSIERRALTAAASLSFCAREVARTARHLRRGHPRRTPHPGTRQISQASIATGPFAAAAVRGLLILDRLYYDHLNMVVSHDCSSRSTSLA